MTDVTTDWLFERLQAAASPSAKTTLLLQFMRDTGQTYYEEVVTQLAHALQCAALADAASADDATVIGALLHDFGHFLQNEQAANGEFLRSDLQHEVVGADFLDHFFGPAVTDPIRHHVAAKRYLCAVDPSYYASLSPASQHSLQLQGGPLNDMEIAAMQRLSHLDSILQIRRWDDHAKCPNQPCPNLDSYAQRIHTLWKA